MSYFSLIFDLLVVPFLLNRKTRLPAFIIAIVFHLINAKIFEIGIFPWLMIALTTIYFSPDWFRRSINLFVKESGRWRMNVQSKEKLLVPVILNKSQKLQLGVFAI